MWHSSFAVGKLFLQSRAHEPIYNNVKSPKFCDEFTYKLAFYTLIVAYVMMALFVGLVVAMCCCMWCCACFGVAAAAAAADHQQQQQQERQEGGQ